MREIELKVKNKKGVDVEALVLVPDTIDEMVKIFGARFVLENMTRAYIAREKRRLISGWKPREKVLKLKVGALTPEQKEMLVTAGLLSSE